MQLATWCTFQIKLKKVKKSTSKNIPYISGKTLELPKSSNKKIQEWKRQWIRTLFKIHRILVEY